MEEKKEKKKMSLDDLLLQWSAPIGLGLRPEEQEEEEEEQKPAEKLKE